MNQRPHRHRHVLGRAAELVAEPVDALSFTIKHAKHDIDGWPMLAPQPPPAAPTRS